MAKGARPAGTRLNGAIAQSRPIITRAIISFESAVPGLGIRSVEMRGFFALL
ncbi:hypothetical protein Astex_3650 (plasmid) [Asticcacaulis excentricus CB 48]|uniref:Uncharacterized protein n=1 Tax=Asticcacaulis excentricus (strain ATCC 15261 / DSM 4724 / KCTC 12464 / NCIMB 9791 / VKM B-1370 / CB 48) TaxID=573065 RepID=E8RVD2_ASTEC|nr:hypothetical protein Astex_3650 [Asticcacaulis excentricus CB 48]